MLGFLSFWRWALVVAWMTVIFMISSIPGSDVPGIVPDYVAHSVEYAILAALMIFAIARTRSPMFAMAATIVFCSAYAATDEIHQLFVPQRTATVFDFAVDSLSVTLVSLIFYGYAKAREKGNLF